MRRSLISAMALPVVAAGGLAVLSWATARTAAVVRDSGMPSTFDDTVGLGALLGAWLATAWLLVGLATAIVAAVPGAAGRALDRFAEYVVPPAVRRIVQVAAGATVVTSGLTLPASGALGQVAPSPLPELDRPVPVVAEASADASFSPAPPSASPSLTSPEAPAASTPPTAPPPHGPGTPEAVVVQFGDTLWHIAAARLGPDPTNAEIAKAWPRWYAANRAVIGTDPDLIFPGQRLQPPD